MTHPENYDDEGRDFTDGQRWTVAEVQTLGEILDRQQAGLERLRDEDPVGATWFEDDDAWVDGRLSRKPPK